MKRLLPGETQLVLSAAKIHKVWVVVWVQNSTIKQQKLKSITSEISVVLYKKFSKNSKNSQVDTMKLWNTLVLLMPKK